MGKVEQSSPPAGTGNTAGLGESFSVNPSTGQGTFSLQIPLPEGVAGLTPRLTLQYAHGVGHGAFGLGFRLPLRSIARRLDFGVPGDGLTERFLDGDLDLVPIVDGSFRACRETAFSRYTRSGDGWRIEDRNGQVHLLGTTAAARVAAPDRPQQPVEWLIESTTDASGNVIRYAYRFDGGMAYPASIRYAAYEVRLAYENRPDVRLDSRAGFLRQRALRCTRLDLVLDPGATERVVRTYELRYRMAPVSQVSLLDEVRLTARGAAADGSDDVRRPTIKLGFSAFDPAQIRVRWMESDAGAPPPLDDPDMALVTLDDAPLPGVLIQRNGREVYWANRGDRRFAAPRPLPRAPISTSFRRDRLAFVDMDGSGTADLMVADPDRLQGYFENGGRAGWGSFVAFPRGQRSAPPWSDRGLRLLDGDGDGLVDALAGRGRGFAWWHNGGRAGWSSPQLAARTASGLAGVDLADPDVHFADMTGSGLSALVRVRSGRVEYWPSLGRGRFGEPVVMQGSPRLRRAARDQVLFADLDGDGCAELIQVASDRLIVYQNQNGQRFAEPVVIAAIPPPLPGTVRALNMTGRAGAGLVWNSVRRGGTGYVVLELAAAQPPYLLERVDNGSGLTTEISYRSAVDDHARDRAAGRPWTTNFPFPYLVVARTRERDAVSGRDTVIDFAYHEAHFERGTRQFEGFRSTERIERGDASRPDTRVVHHFRMAEELAPGHGREHAAQNGLVARIETYALDGSTAQDRALRIETCDHGVEVLDTARDGRQRCFVFVAAHRTEDSERTDDRRIEHKAYSYDHQGNVVREVLEASGVRSGVDQAVRRLVTETSYAASGTHYLLGKPARVVVRDGDGKPLSEKRFYYDGADFTGLPLGQAERGLLAREEEWVLTQAEFDAHYAGMNQADLGFTSAPSVDGTASVFATPRRLRHDARGLVIAQRDPLGVETAFAWDPSGLFRTALADALGTTRFAYDRATGQVTDVTYADGRVSRFAYDAQGRVVRSARPGEDIAHAATVYSYDESVLPCRRTARFRQGDGTTTVGITYFDGAGQEFQQRVEVGPGRFLVSALKLPNPWGDLREEYEPVFATSAELAVPDTAGRPVRRFFYDARGRAVRSINFNGGVSSLEIEPFRIVTRDANDNDDSPDNRARGQTDTPHVEEFDVLRYLVRVIDQTAPGATLATGYEIGPLGELLTASDPGGVKLRCRYDRRGSRLSITLRESGERKVWYDARKKPVRTLDPAGHDLTASFDALGRQLRLAAGATVLEEYHYDTAAQGALGRIAQVTYVGGSQVFHYDPAGHLVQRDYHHDGEPARSVRWEYDPLGRETAVIHADGTRVERRLAANGWLTSIPGVIRSVEYDPRGLPTDVAYDSGVRCHMAYTPGPGRLRHQTLTSPRGEVLQDLELGYDRMELLVTRSDAAPGARAPEHYRYDPLYQLTGIDTTENGAPAHRRYDYAGYNLQRSDEARTTLRYDDAARPDRLTGITPDAGAVFACSYDGNGNLLGLPGQRFAYNAKNELARFERSDGLTAEYRYDHLGQRTSKVVTDAHGHVTRTFYLGELCEVRDGIPFHCVAFAGVRVAVLGGGAVRFLHDDGVGGTALVTDARGHRIGAVDTGPFGNPAAQSGDVDFRIYSRHPVDAESGLVYMRRRYYAPQIGRFLTPDLMATYQPEKFIHAPQGLHLYAFVANDPLNKQDSTGLSFWSFLGSVVGVVVGIIAAVAIVAAVVATGGIAGVLLGIGLALGASLVVTGVSYLVASNVDPNSGFGQFMRGFMIGFNAGMNGVLAAALFGPVVGVALGVINFLATFDGIAQNSVYQGILGWTSWFMPMSWGMTALGVATYVINLVVAGVTFQQWNAAKIDKLDFDWKTGSFVMSGGLIRGPTAFNLGNFVFMNPNYVDGSTPDRTYNAVLAHETGHTLNTAAFGTAFELADFIGENAVGAGANDYGEELAESHARRAGRPTIPMWG